MTWPCGAGVGRGPRHRAGDEPEVRRWLLGWWLRLLVNCESKPAPASCRHSSPTAPPLPARSKLMFSPHARDIQIIGMSATSELPAPAASWRVACRPALWRQLSPRADALHSSMLALHRPAPWHSGRPGGAAGVAGGAAVPHQLPAHPAHRARRVSGQGVRKDCAAGWCFFGCPRQADEGVAWLRGEPLPQGPPFQLRVLPAACPAARRSWRCCGRSRRGTRRCGKPGRWRPRTPGGPASSAKVSNCKRS